MDADTFDRIMLDAINEEIMAHEFYKAAAARMKDASAVAIFERLAAEEEGHRRMLEQFRFNPKAQVEFRKIEDDYKIAEAETLPRLSFEMKPADAFRLAMKKEQQAMETYAAMAERIADAEFKKLYRELAEMEKGHKTQLEELFVNAAFPEDWGE